MASLCFLTCIIIFSFQSISSSNAAFTLKPSQNLTDGQFMASQGETFMMGFLNVSNSDNRYLGIWYNTIPVQTVVWVANRDAPVTDKSGVLRMRSDGNLVIVNGTGSVLWSTNSSRPVENPIMEFLESGNIVLREESINDPDNYLWQSFDYPVGTLLPGMRLGWNLTTGQEHSISAWRSSNDPSHGDFAMRIDITGSLEPVITKGSEKYYRAGPWNGRQFSGAADLRPNSLFTYRLLRTPQEVYFVYQLVDPSVLMRYALTQTGTDGYLERYTWSSSSNSWVRLVSIPRDRCDDYGLCGNYSTCDVTNVEVCMCLEGFRPKSQQEWSSSNWDQGCERRAALNCTHGDGFKKYTGVKLPDTSGSWVNASFTLEECRVRCLNNCSCMAYANSDVRGSGSGCIMWLHDLVDIRQMSDDGQDLYIRMAASELVSNSNSRRKGLVIAMVSITAVGAAILALGLGSWCIWKKRSLKGDSERDDLELPLYEFGTISSATDNFSAENKLGEGGFGPVYKGKLDSGQDIAVKRLSKDSTQGIEEFKNEVILIAKLQHRNLVRLLGCCIQREEKMLVYEYMKNKSLDFFIFDETKRRLLDWKMRFNIILGIARGLLYLHHDSRLRIIHRDLKASNILLDNEMVPKISDFGMARIFGGDQMEAKTERVVGTHGYMSPEYAVDGHFSVKSDVFSFGVLVLEILSGRKNRGFFHADHQLNLLGHAWKLWNDDKSIEMVDEVISTSCSVEDVLRCIHIGLLCVQNSIDRRPTMSSVVLMLSSENVVLPRPQAPGFYIERSSTKSDSSYTEKSSSSYTYQEPYISNDFTITLIEGR